MSAGVQRGQTWANQPGRRLVAPTPGGLSDALFSSFDLPGTLPGGKPTDLPTSFAAAEEIMHDLLVVVKDGGINLFRPLALTLDAILTFGTLGGWKTEAGFDALVHGLAAVLAVAKAVSIHPPRLPEADEIIGDQSVDKHLRAITAIVLQLWRAINKSDLNDPSADSRTTGEELEYLVQALVYMMDVFVFIDHVSIEDRLVLIRQRISSQRPTATVTDRGSCVTNNTGNTTWNFGRDVVNNNWVNNYVFSEPTIPDLAKRQEKIMNTIAGKTGLGDQFVPGAVHDTQPKEAGCMPGTRLNVLSKFISWVKDDPKAIFWLAGMAGTGKTSIALTLCRMLQVESDVVLGGTFFCSRSAGSVLRTDVRRILPTLAWSLASQFPEFAAALAGVLKADNRAVHRPISDQLDRLLGNPLGVLALSTRTIVFVVDALDECSSESDLAELLTAISDFESELKVKFILTSRPEMHIRGTSISNPTHNSILHLHTIREEDITADIRYYVAGSLRAAAPDASWYTLSDVEDLVALSHGLFIFASTVLRYILDRENSKGRLERLRKLTSAVTATRAATASLDLVYELIVGEASRSDRVDAEEFRATQQVLASILAARASLSVQALSYLLDLGVDDIRGSLERLHSVVYMPGDDTIPGVRVLHASFGDYLYSRAAVHIRISASLGSDVLARGCLRIMRNRLYFNISQSQSSYRRNRTQIIPDTIDLSLEYSCLQWTFHVSDLPQPMRLYEDINQTFPLRFLFWLEVLSVLGQVQRAKEMLLSTAAAFHSTTLSLFLRDAGLFVAFTHSAIELSTPHIYLSALPFAAKNSSVYKTFFPLCTGLLSVDAAGMHRVNWTKDELLPGHTDQVRSVAVSADGALIVSGSRDQSVCVWDARTGELKYPPLLGHTDWVTAVIVSSDGRRIVSLSWDCSVRMWDVYTGTPLGMLWQRDIDHRVCAMAFSPDAKWLALGSQDTAVYIWSIGTGQQFILHALPCSGSVHAVTFSHAGTLVAAGDSRGCVYIWEATTGQPICHPLQSPRHTIYSIAFSPNGTHIVSGGFDSICRIWDITNGDLVLALEGHTHSLRSVAFSPSGQYICSASADRTIRLWDSTTGRSITTLRGHKDCVRSAAFTPDGLSIVSCSDDKTIRVWDVELATSMSVTTENEDILAALTARFKEGYRVNEWLLGNHKELLLWIPDGHLQIRPCKMLIGQSRIIIEPGTGGLHLGDEWTACWRNVRPAPDIL